MPSASAASSTPRATAAAPCPRLSSAQRQLGAHGAHDQLGLGVLEHHAGDAPSPPGRARACPDLRRTPARRTPAVEVRHEAAGGAQQRRLARGREPGEQAELTRRDRQLDIAQRRRAAPG